MKNKIYQPKVFIDLAKDNYVLTRKEDNKQMTGALIKFVEWKKDGTAKAMHDQPMVGRSIVLDPMSYGNYQWLTTEIIEIISDTEFKTKNSTYTLHKL
tara:strand:+ start:265 stop:558 length:294 start_codon:yes stop_codon:yes gene_type:complete